MSLKQVQVGGGRDYWRFVWQGTITVGTWEEEEEEEEENVGGKWHWAEREIKEREVTIRSRIGL